MFTASALFLGKAIILLVITAISNIVTFILVLGAYLILNKTGYYPRDLSNISPTMKYEIQRKMAEDRIRQWIRSDSRKPRDEGYYYTYFHGAHVAVAVGAFVAALVFGYCFYAVV